MMSADRDPVIWSPDHPCHTSWCELGFPRLSRLAGTSHGIGGRVAAVAPGAERGGVLGAIRDRGGVPEGAARDALARGPHLPGLRPSRLLRAQDPPAVPVQPRQEAGTADRRHRVTRLHAAY